MDTPERDENGPEATDISSWKAVTAPASQIFQTVGTAFLELHRRWKTALPEILTVLRRLAQDMPPAYRSALVEIAKHGWYIDQRMGVATPIEIAGRLVRGESRKQVDDELCSHFTAHLDDIEGALCKAFAHRAHIIGPAFTAHRAGQYVLSIPVLLAQADGICYEKVNAYHFVRDRRSNGKHPATAAHAGAEEHDFWNSIFLSPLGAVAPLNMKESERGEDFSGLNRHTVMHGSSLDYGTEINSLKAISFVNYVCQVLTYRNLKLAKS